GRHEVEQEPDEVDLEPRVLRYLADDGQVGPDAGMEQRVDEKTGEDAHAGRGEEPNEGDAHDTAEHGKLAAHVVDAERDRGEHQRDDDHAQRLDEGLTDGQKLLAEIGIERPAMVVPVMCRSISLEPAWAQAVCRAVARSRGAPR